MGAHRQDRRAAGSRRAVTRGPSASTGARPAARSPGGRTASRTPAADLPVARVAVDVPLPHLDRLFDYLVPAQLAESAVPGCRVRVRFSGRLTGGYLVERADGSEHQGKLAYLERVLSAEPVLTPEIAGLARAVADRYGGTLADVLRLAIPPRHAAVEKAASSGRGGAAPAQAGGAAVTVAPGSDGSAGDQGLTASASLWARYPAGLTFLAALRDGRAPRAVWSALPGRDWPAQIAHAAAVTAASGRGALVVVPDARDLGMLEEALTAEVGDGGYVSLAARLGPAERYRRWLAVLRGQVQVVAGTRSAVFAPLARLGLVVIWDDGDDLHEEPRAPYPQARDVLVLRAHRSGAAALIGGFARTAEAAHLLASGWARPLEASRPTVRQHAPMVVTAGEDSELARDQAARSARMPALALRTARAALADGPVLFQVPRRGYLAAVACRRCGSKVRCAACAGPVALGGSDQPLRCGWCGATVPRVCAHCGDTGLRALVTGARRTAEELGRAFAGTAVLTSAGSAVLAQVPAAPAIVIATPGAEPLAPQGYSAAVLLDSWALLGRPSLRAGQEALRRWMNAAALVRPGGAGGKVVLMADPGLSAVQALIRWDAATFASRELAEREELHFPPAVRMAALTGQAEVVAELLSDTELPAGATVLGPVDSGIQAPGEGRERAVRYLVRVPGQAGTALAVALRCGMAKRSARKDQGQVRLQLDPAELI